MVSADAQERLVLVYKRRRSYENVGDLLKTNPKSATEVLLGPGELGRELELPPASFRYDPNTSSIIVSLKLARKIMPPPTTLRDRIKLFAAVLALVIT